MRNYVLSLVLTVGVLLAAGSVAALKPPPALNEILKELVTFEESFDIEQWQQAEQSLGKIDAELQRVFIETRLDDPDLKKALWALQKSVDRKDKERTQVHYQLLQKQYFTFLEGFDYEVPPLLIILQRYVVVEAPAYYAKRDYNGVVAEMREIANLVDQTKSLFREKGIARSEVDDFKAKLIEAMGAGHDHDDGRIRALLTELKETYLSFMERYRGA